MLLLRHISLLSLVSHFIFPSLMCLLLMQSGGLKGKPATNIEALEHEVEKAVSGCAALKTQIHIQHFSPSLTWTQTLKWASCV